MLLSFALNYLIAAGNRQIVFLFEEKLFEVSSVFIDFINLIILLIIYAAQKWSLIGLALLTNNNTLSALTMANNTSLLLLLSVRLCY